MNKVCICIHAMHMGRIGIFGASGYAGVELTKLVAAHGQLKLVFLASERHVGTSVESFTGVGGAAGRMAYASFEESRALAKECDAVFLATPAEVSLALVPELVKLGVRVVDLSGAFRIRDGEVFQKAYAHAPPSSELQAKAVYGMPELFRADVKGAALVSNPGCYPTAATLALAPLLSKKVIATTDLIVSAMSGASGAGRKAAEEYSLVELHSDVKAYKVLAHQHTPEIAQSLSRVAGQKLSLTFTPHLLPIPRGILSTAYARLTKKSDSATLTQALKDAYRGEAFVRVVEKPELVTLNSVVGTNVCCIGVACEPNGNGRVVVVSAIDNLVKGAAGQALQNLNLMLGLEETAGLASLRRFHP